MTEIISTAVVPFITLVLLVIAISYILKNIGFTTFDKKKPNSCAKCGKTTNKSEEIASLKHATKKALDEGKYYCKECLGKMLGANQQQRGKK